MLRCIWPGADEGGVVPRMEPGAVPGAVILPLLSGMAGCIEPGMLGCIEPGILPDEEGGVVPIEGGGVVFRIGPWLGLPLRGVVP